MRDLDDRDTQEKFRRWPGGRQIARFRDDESGAMIVFGLVFFIIILMLSGISVDVIRHESLRTRLQNTLDTGVLAAASLSQTQDRKAVVYDYMNKAGLGAYVTDVQVTGGSNQPTVYATAKAEMPTTLMRLDGIDKTTIPAASTASQAVSNLEISLVLDVSGSMNNYNKIGKLRDAATSFVTQMFATSAPGKLSISVIPYAAQVTAGPDLFNYFKVKQYHNYSYCFDFDPSDYSTTEMPPHHTYQQAGNFDPWYTTTQIDTYGLRVCPKDPHRYILPFSSDETQIKAAIAALTARGNTSIDVGMKWGVGLLDPTTQNVVDGMIKDGLRPADLAGRPAAYSDNNTMKVVVVMTDGANTSRPVLQSPYNTGPSNVWANKTDPNNYSLKGKPGTSHSTQWYWTKDGKWHNAPYGASKSNIPDPLKWPEVWEKLSVRWFLNYMVGPALGYQQANSDWSSIVSWMNPQDPTISGTQDNDLIGICDAAKAEGITIYSIGFMADPAGKSVLQNCATKTSFFFDVQSLDIATAFDSIANSITKLRLTQ